MKVRDIMTTGITCISMPTPITEVSKRMERDGVEVVAVCHSGKFRGLVAKDDVADYIAHSGNRKKGKIGKLAKRLKPQASPGLESMEAARIMARSDVRALPVTQNGMLLGVLTWDDVAKDRFAASALALRPIPQSRPGGTKQPATALYRGRLTTPASSTW